MSIIFETCTGIELEDLVLIVNEKKCKKSSIGKIIKGESYGVTV